MSWFNRGYGNLEEEEKKLKDERDRKYRPDRFWVWVSDFERPNGKDVIFLDDNPVKIYEHAVVMYDKEGNKIFKNNQFTCRSGVGEDPSCRMCLEDVRRYYVGFYTVIDCSEWTNREGVVIKNTRKLFAAKMDAMKILKDRSNRLKETQKTEGKPIVGLVGARMHIKRTSNKSPSEGSDFVYVKHENIEFVDGKVTLADKDFYWKDKEGRSHVPEPYNYEKILAPLSNEEMKRVLSRANSKGGDIFDEQASLREREQKNTNYY